MSEKGKLIRLIGKEKIVVAEEAVPDVAEDAMLLEIGCAGICGTDIHIIENADKEPFVNDLPLTLGHEVTGRIVKMGKKADDSFYCDERLKEGDRVVVYMFLPCNNCWWDRRFGANHTLICSNPLPGLFAHSDKPPYFVAGWGEFLYLPAGAWVFKIPEDMEWELAVLTEPFSMGIRAVEKAFTLPGWKNLQTIGFGGTVVVQGSGAIGILTAVALKIAGVGKVIMTGGPHQALELAKEIGAADVTIDIFETTPEQRIAMVKEMTEGGNGADAVFETAGVPEAFLEGLEMVRKLGTFVELGCLIDDGRTVPINVARQIVQKDISLFGVLSQPPQDFIKSLRCLEQYNSRFDFRKIITARFRIEQAEEAIALVRDPKRKGIKTIFTGKAIE
ncbi:zinc-binding dehydrogenase [Candidatus Sumerlaeota bacterium]|nr:zinc-binding dehydrogenase [Candidatus Sumerlaeota bacterium]